MARLRKRWLWLLATVLAAVAVVLGVVLADSLRPVNRVQNGMTRQQVEWLLGPPDRVDTWPPNGCPVYVWRFRDGSVVTVFTDGQGRVLAKGVQSPEPEWKRRLRALGLPF
jgi:hypothetical protein